jgi:hypothetical protein
MKRILNDDNHINLPEAKKVLLLQKGFALPITIICKDGLQIFCSFKPDPIFSDIDVGEEDHYLSSP